MNNATTKSFSFSTEIVNSYNNKKACTAIISGSCCQHSTTEDGEFDRDYCDFDDVNVILEIGDKRQDCTFAYLADKILMGDLCDAIDAAIARHCELLFKPVEERAVFAGSYRPASETTLVNRLGDHAEGSDEERNPSLCH